MIEIAYSIRKMNIIMGLDLAMTAPLSVLITNKMVRMSTVMNSKRVYLINQAVQCNQLLSPIIFIDSCTKINMDKI
jgi:hypothetical protein